MTSPATSSLRPTTDNRVARWRGWYINSGRSSLARSPRFDAIGSFWLEEGGRRGKHYWRELFTNSGIMTRVGYRRGRTIWVMGNGLMITR